MPPADETADAPVCNHVDWAEVGSESSRSRRTAVFTALLIVFVAAFVTDYTLVSSSDPFVAGYDPTAMDWLFGFSLCVFVFGLASVASATPERFFDILTQVRGRPAEAASLGYLVAFFFVGLFGPVLVGQPSPDVIHASQPPVFATVHDLIIGNCVGTVTEGLCHGTFQFPFGTDPFGRDMLWVTVQGAHIALQVALVSSVIIVPIATIVGVTAGYFGGPIDTLLMRYVDIQQSVPALVFYFIAIFVFGRSLFLIVLIFGFLGWGGIARIVRGAVLSLRNEHYVTAAKSAGASNLNVLRKHIVPNVADTVIVSTAQQIPYLILVEASLSFMKLNAIELPSWGETIRWGMGEYFPMFWWISAWPILFLVLTILAFGLFGDVLQDALDPQE
ncbi:ABC transporter permease [Halogeometricum borinquense]|uniref:ABC transporter permease n=1 Tax=Halogeometricum borinquense TaxID=60847 RepID=UPI00341B9BA3